MKRFICLSACLFVSLSLWDAAAARPYNRDHKTLAVTSEQTAVRLPDLLAGPLGNVKSAPSRRHAGGASRPRSKPDELAYVDGMGLCSTTGPVVLPGSGDPAIPTATPNVAWSLQGCPAGPARAGGAPPPPPSPRDAATAVWWETTLPDPTMATSPPTGAITGLDLFLSIGGPQKVTFDVPSLGYIVHLDVNSTYDVDWGDPAPDGSAIGAKVTRGHRTQGGPYPNGDLRHQYIDRGAATITVTQRWTASWTAGGESGTISDVLYTDATSTIPVQEIQAVITG